jgi:hypothetical protein
VAGRRRGEEGRSVIGEEEGWLVIVGEEEGRPVVVGEEEARPVIVEKEEGLRLARVLAGGIE